MSALPKPGTLLGNAHDIPDPGGRVSSWNEGGVILIKRDGKISAWLNDCPHAGMRLSLPDGRVMVHKDGFIVCPIHGASFATETGFCVGGPAADENLVSIAVDIVGHEVFAK